MPIISRVSEPVGTESWPEAGIADLIICPRASNHGICIVKDNRPVNLDIGSMKLPITAYASITHRVSGVFLFVGVGLLIWMLDASLSSSESFASLANTLSSVPAKLLLWAVLAGAAYHSVAGIKHLIMDFGIGESLEGGVMGARIVIASAVVLTLLAGAWIW